MRSTALISKHKPSLKVFQNSSFGFTLIELVFVIVIIAVISLLAISRIDSIILWQQKGEIRRFTNVWETLFSEASSRGDSYRLVIDLDDNSYFVRREVKPLGTFVQQVDYAKNLRTKAEKERRSQAAQEDLPSMKEVYAAEDAREAASLETLFYQTLFQDPESDVQLTSPLEFPSLAKTTTFGPGLRFRDVKTEHGTVYKGQVSIRFSPRGGSEFAVVHFELEDHVITTMMNPSTGEMTVFNGEKDFEWTLGHEQTS